MNDDYTNYQIEFNSDLNCSVAQRMRVRWNADGTATAFEWRRNPETQIGYGWKRYDVSRVTVDDAPAVLSAFAPSGHTVRCASATIRPWGRDELEIQGVADRHLAVVEPSRT